MSGASGAFPADPVLEQLPLALDAAHMRRVLVGHFAGRGSRGLHVETCRIDRIRYRRGERCVIQYALGLRTERGVTRPGWMTAEMYASDETSARWRRLRAADGASGRSSTVPSLLLPDLGMIVHLFPHDPRLPALARLAAPVPPRELRVALLAGSAPAPARGGAWTVETLRYRAGLGATLCYSSGVGADPGRGAPGSRFYVKVYPGGGALAGYAVLDGLWRRSAGSDAQPGVARPIACLPRLGALVQGEAPGVSFEAILSEGHGGAVAARLIGRALARLHLDDIGGGGFAVPVRTRGDDIAIVRRVVRQLACGDPDARPDLENLTGAISTGLPEAARRPTHGDLKIEHILLDGERVRLIDVDNFALGDPVTDLASLLADMTRFRLRRPEIAGDLRAPTAALVEEYFGRVPGWFRRRLPVCYAGALLDKAGYFFRRQEPDWRVHARSLIVEAGEALAGRYWW